MRNFEFNVEYYLTTYSELEEYLKSVINDDSDKQIKYIFIDDALC